MDFDRDRKWKQLKRRREMGSRNGRSVVVLWMVVEKFVLEV